MLLTYNSRLAFSKLHLSFPSLLYAQQLLPFRKITIYCKEFYKIFIRLPVTIFPIPIPISHPPDLLLAICLSISLCAIYAIIANNTYSCFLCLALDARLRRTFVYHTHILYTTYFLVTLELYFNNPNEFGSFLFFLSFFFAVHFHLIHVWRWQTFIVQTLNIAIHIAKIKLGRIHGAKRLTFIYFDFIQILWQYFSLSYLLSTER